MGHTDVLIRPPIATFPDASNTGPSGALTVYSGPTLFSSGVTTISNKTVNDDFDFSSGSTATLNLVNCQVNGHIHNDETTATINATDCNIDATTWSGGAVTSTNIYLTRCNVQGGGSNIIIGNGTLTRCYIHGAYLGPSAGTHNEGLLSSGADGLLVDNCTIECTTGANYSATWGWEPAKPFPIPSNVKSLYNAFGRGVSGHGGTTGTNSSWYVGNGNQWTGNYWLDTGLPINYDE